MNSSLMSTLYRHFEQWGVKVLRHPRVNIVLPLLIVILLSYNTFSQFQSSSPTNGYISRVNLVDEKIPSDNVSFDYQLTMSQVWVESLNEDGNILGKKSLLECLAFQNKVVKGMPEMSAVSSPFQIWNHSLVTLQKDQTPLQSINSNRMSIPRYSFFKTWKVNGQFSSAAGFIISILAARKDASKVQQILSDNIEYLNTISNVTSFHVLAPHRTSEIAGSSEAPEVFNFFFMALSKGCNLMLTLLYVLLAFYIIGSIRRYRSFMKSVAGIVIAMFTQTALAIASSLTVTNLVFKGTHDNVPVQLFCWPIILFLSNLQLRTIDAVSRSHGDDDDAAFMSNESSRNFGDERRFSLEGNKLNFTASLSRAHFESIKGSAIFSLIVVFLVPFSRRVTHFLLCSLWIGHFLQFTFFAAVLSLDFRRLNEFNSIENLGSDIRLDDEVAEKLMSKRKNFALATSNVITVFLSLIYLIICNQKFSLARPSSSILFKLFNYGWKNVIDFQKPIPKALFDQHFVAEYVLDSGAEQVPFETAAVSLSMVSPILALKSTNEALAEEQLISSFSRLFITPSSTSSYEIDLYYAVQIIVFIILALSCTLLILQKLMERLDIVTTVYLFDGGSNSKHSAGNAKEKETEERPESPNLNTMQALTTDNFHMKELYRGGHSLDIMMIVSSKSPFVVSVGLDHCVYVWSPLVNPIPNPTRIPLPRKFWPLSKVTLSNDGNYLAFFSENGYVTVSSRRHMKFIWELKLRKDQRKGAFPLEALFRKKTIPAFRNNRRQSLAKKAEASGRRASVASSEFIPMVTGGLDATYEKVEKVNNPADENELIFVTSDGLIYSVCDDGDIKVENLTASDNQLKTCKFLSSPRVNDRLVICDEMGDLFIATVVNNKWRTRKLQINYSRVLKPPSSSCELKDNSMLNDNLKNTPNLSSTDHTIELVSFVGLIVRVIGKTADLLDAQTGSVIRSFAIVRFKPNSLRVFHDSPVHCKFCGSASVASFSIAYSEEESDRVTMHTYKLESKTKTSICLRVERDLREIRCLGMESAIDTVHYIYDVEDWCVTDNNMLMGMRKVPQNVDSSKFGSSSISVNPSNEMGGSIMSNRKDNKLENYLKSDSSAYQVHSIWEGWTMSASGKFSLHKIPVGVNGLASDNLGPLTKFGAKAVIVGFANIMKMFYMGHEDLIFSTEANDATKEETGLRFVNKRRNRLSHKKLPLDYNSL